MEMNQQGDTRIHQVLVKLLDGTHRFLNFKSPIITVQTLKHRIETLTSAPAHHHLLLLNRRALPESDHQNLNLSPFGDGGFPAVVNISARLRGGKGGFGSLLRGSATKAGQKKTNNFDACRDMSGRRIRHVNAEKKIEEWKAGAEERQLEKTGEDYIRKKAKEAAKKGLGKGAEVEKYLQKYNADLKKCREEVEKSTRESMKRKLGPAGAGESKKMKIWYGKQKMGISDSEDDSEEDEDEDEENNKSVVLNNRGHSDSSEEAKGSSDSVNVASSSGSGVSESTSEEEKAAVEEIREAEESKVVHEEQLVVSDEHNMPTSVVETEAVHEEKANEPELVSAVEEVMKASVLPIVDEAAPATSDFNGTVADAEPVELEKPLNFDEINSAADLEVLGMDRLKSELQTRGLKCGGTLQERAARLFLLKTTPIEKLPKKYFAKK